MLLDLLWPLLRAPVRAPVKLSWPLGFILLTFLAYTITYPNLRHVRTAFAIPCLALWYAAAFPPDLPHMEVRGNYQTIFILGAFWWMKTVDVALVGWLRQPTPRLCAVKIVNEKGHERAVKEALPLPTTLLGRLGYAVDYVLSSRGTSFYHNTVWDWTSDNLLQAQYGNKTVREQKMWKFVLQRFGWIILSFLQVDFTELIMVNGKFDVMALHPVTRSGRSLVVQCWYTICAAAFFIWGMELQYQAFALVVGLLSQSDPASWPPLNNQPWKAESLSDFWSLRWHTAISRGLERVALPFTVIAHRLVPSDIPPRTEKILKNFLRCCCIFSVSTVLHLASQKSIPEDDEHRVVWVEWNIIRFYMVQPIGLMIDALLLRPLAQDTGSTGKMLRRAWFWTWLLWTGREYIDGMTPGGAFEAKTAQPSAAIAIFRVLGLQTPNI